VEGIREFQIQGVEPRVEGNWAAGVGMAFETHGPSGPEGPITAGLLHLYRSFGGPSDATLPYYLDKREKLLLSDTT